MMGTIVFHFFAFLGNFPMRLLIPALLFLVHTPRRPLFRLRVLVLVPYLFIPQFIGSFFLLPVFHIGAMNWSFLLWYLYLILGLWFCFDISFGQIMYAAIASYIIQNIVQDILNPISMVVFRNRISAYEVQNVAYFAQDPSHAAIVQNEYALFYVILYVGIMSVIYMIFAFTFVLDWLGKRELEVKRWMLVFLMVSMLLMLNLFSYILLQNDVSNKLASGELIHYSMVSLLLALCSLMMLTLQRSIFAQTQAEKEKEIIERLLSAEKQQLVFSKESINLINMKAHDLKGQIAALRSLPHGQTEAEQEKLYVQMEETLRIYDAQIRTGSDVLDILLTEKMLYCTRNHIQLSCIIDGASVVQMDSADIYSLFGNALNNAIESAEKAVTTQERNISLRISRKGTFLCVELENYCGITVSFQDGLPVTTKRSESGWHGFGTRSMKYIVEKYHGNLIMWQEGNHFITNIMIPLQTAPHAP